DGAPATGEPIKIGLPNDETSLPQFSQGLQAYVDDWNNRGGFNGRPIQLITEDLTSDPATAAAVGQKLVNQDNVVAVLSTNSNLNCTANGSFENSEKVAVLYNSIDAACLDFDNFFGFMNPAPDLTVPGVAWLIDQGAKNTAFLVPEFPGVESQADGMKKYAADHGVDFKLEFVPLASTAADFDAAVADLKKTGVDGVFALAGGPGYTLMIQSATNQDYFVDNGVKWLFGPTLYAPSALSAVPELSLGGGVLTQTIPFEVDDPAVKEIFTKLSAATDTVDGFTALAWNSGAALESALSKIPAGTDVTRESVLAAFNASTSVKLPLSTVDADLTSRTNPPAGAVVEVKDGKFVVESDFFEVK
ncbi:MAG: branched-chain amino acid transporterubstrate-binding protein, partial [Ilumatobacteraceae bacterium]|nr:branched-chain amino acid transporterubstrate-binding protein [Ilumatobacteraceae bacterium]